ncbi:MAG: DNA-binding transcriptional regulator Fis [Gammaproteobacteria bacterium]|nr:DNA-binding transcriptional regulator Fis [Gammaproteobacteria bacterium]NIO61820.1 DNA-binding transcriptional regulator Fis [Gammaproteobacteria bacterium]NIP48691.1 DNA-binding transcriptional regulator Fis [Gammaproteobacteria bacterium]NIQ09143.1 DNA-binding transcriptional regulator Fis [Gammaproteobacteria bacterium]NIQ19071.1 DNA-binding transcriptional regulator Fis [Gammaproteobacteria bacterium]
MTALKAVKDDVLVVNDNKSCLGEDVRRHMENYFRDLEGHEVSDLYELVMSEVEKPIFEIVMQQTRGNITKAASMLGLNRGTLRNRLKKYKLV